MSALHSTCPLCDGARLGDLYPVMGYTIARCRDCTQTFVRERVTEAELAAFYGKQETDYVYDDPGNLANLSYYFDRIRALISKTVPQGRLLDVGCNAGQFLDAMKGSWDCHGIELAPHFARQAMAKHGDRIHQGTLVDCGYPDGYFDVITMMDVLDHSSDPLKDLRLANRRLRAGGLLVVKVHNISCLWARLAKDKFYAICPPGHLFYFDDRTLKLALGKTGFVPTDTRFIGNRISLKTIPYRLARGSTGSPLYRLFRMLDGTRLGDVSLYKNFFDIVTVLAVKREDVAAGPGGKTDKEL